jgi:Fe-S-cluster containining protein
VQNKLLSLCKHKFSDIALSRENADYIIKIGKKNKIYLDRKTGLWFVKPNKDNSCPFHIKGLCKIYESQPPMCKAYPLYLDPFAGLCIDASCPGAGKGWTKMKDLKKEISALEEINNLWIKAIKQK